jgi:hypothetical protein
MGQMQVWWYAVMLASIVAAAPEPVDEATMTINTAKLAQVVSERFLSLTIDPAMLLFGKDFR